MGFLQLPQDILLYRGELARCADLLAFQLGKELLFRQNSAEGFFLGGRPQNPGGKTKWGQTIYIYINLGQNPK